jgi:hypothetical protein
VFHVAAVRIGWRENHMLSFVRCPGLAHVSACRPRNVSPVINSRRTA